MEHKNLTKLTDRCVSFSPSNRRYYLFAMFFADFDCTQVMYYLFTIFFAIFDCYLLYRRFTGRSLRFFVTHAATIVYVT
jgi:hypothetical protein